MSVSLLFTSLSTLGGVHVAPEDDLTSMSFYAFPRFKDLLISSLSGQILPLAWQGRLFDYVCPRPRFVAC